MKKTITLPLLFLFLLPSLHAIQDFTATTNPSFDLCPCSGQGIPVDLTNTGDEQATFRLAVDAQSATWVSISPNNFILQPNQATQIVLSVNSACNIEGVLPTTLFVSTETVTKALSIDLFFNACYNHTITPGQVLQEEQVQFIEQVGTYHICADQTSTIPFALANNDSLFNNNYALSVTDHEWLSLNPAQTSLDAQKDGLVLLSASPSLKEIGNYSVAVSSTSQVGQVRAQSLVDVVVHDCFELGVELNPAEEYCAGVTQEFSAVITNDGRFTENIKLTADPEWVQVPEQVTIDSQDQQEIIVRLNAPADTNQKQEITLTASTPDTSANEQVKVTVRKQSACYELSVDAPSYQYVFESFETTPVVVKNTGRLAQDVDVSLNAPSWVALEGSPSITLNPDESYTYALTAKPVNVTDDNYDATVTFNTSVESVQETVVVKKRDKNPTIEAITSFAYSNRYYGVLLAFALILFAFVMSPLGAYLKRQREKEKMKRVTAVEKEAAKADKQKKSKAKEEKKAVKKATVESPPASPWLYVGMGVGLLILIFAVCYALYPTQITAFFSTYGPHVFVGVVLLVALGMVATVMYRSYSSWKNHKP